jgi:hypothetical protein
MKLVMKLPFLTYSPQEKTLSNLDEDISKSFSARQSIIYNTLLNTPLDTNELEFDKIINDIWGTKNGED